MRPDSESTAKVVPLGAALRLSSDGRLARLAAGGNRAAFATIFDRYHQDLYRYCVSLLRNTEDAADALQNTMLHAMRALQGDDRDIALRPWLYRIAHNESISLIRRRDHAERAIEPTWAAELDVEGSAALRDRLNTLLADIRTLPERQRAALVMRELADLSYGEIAAALETSPAGAKQAVYDARRALLDLSRGRDTNCEVIQHRISAGDRRAGRARAVRAHLRACAECRLFEAQIGERESALAGLAPILPAAVAAHALKGPLVGAGGTSAESVLIGAGTTAAGQALATVALTVALGAGVAGVELAERGEARGDAPGRTWSTVVSPGGRELPGATRGEAAGRRTGSVRTPGSTARGVAGDSVPEPRGSRPERGRDDEADAATTAIEQRTATVAAPAQGGPPARRGGRLGLGQGSDGSGEGGESGPVRTTVDDVRHTVTGTVDGVSGTIGATVDGVSDTVDGVTGSLPVSTPAVRSPLGGR